MNNITTIEELIKKMEYDGYRPYLLQNWYEDLKKDVEFCKDLLRQECIFINTEQYKRIDIYYYKILGYIWSLTETYNILEDERNLLSDELLKSTQITEE